MAKHVVWWKSKLLWANAVMAGLAALEAGTGILQPLIPANIYAVIAVTLPVVNAMIRVINGAEKLYVEKRDTPREKVDEPADPV